MGSRRAFAAWSAIAALLLLAGQHRAFYALAAPLPDLAASALAGLADLSWYELAYAIGAAAKRPAVFVAIPYLGIATGFLPVFGLARPAWFRPAALSHLGAALFVGGLALVVLIRQGLYGFWDPWRTVTTLAFLAAHAAWAVAFFRRPVASPAPRLAIEER